MKQFNEICNAIQAGTQDRAREIAELENAASIHEWNLLNLRPATTMNSVARKLSATAGMLASFLFASSSSVTLAFVPTPVVVSRLGGERFGVETPRARPEGRTAVSASAGGFVAGGGSWARPSAGSFGAGGWGSRG